MYYKEWMEQWMDQTFQPRRKFSSFLLYRDESMIHVITCILDSILMQSRSSERNQ
jgi:hypothetical protein